MRRLMLLAVSILAVVSMAISPAFADDRDDDGWDEDFGFWVLVPVSVNYEDTFDYEDYFDHNDYFDYEDHFGYNDTFDHDDYFNYDDYVIEEVEFEDGVLEDVEFEAV
jgi:hypothetical protein